MAGVNRYTQLSTTQFNPLSMEEMSVLPAMMRQRHDLANAEMEKRRTELNALAITSPEYAEEAKALINQMNSGIDNLSTELNRNGYNSMTRSNLMGLNRDYQQLVSPTGRLGQMISAEKLNAERYNEHLEAAQKAGHSTADAMRNWVSNKKNYTGYDNEGNITAINSLGVPKYVDMMEDLKNVKSIIGEYQRRLDKAGGGNVQIRSDGSALVVSKSGSVQRITNDPQLTKALELLKTKWLSPDGEGFRSAMYQGKNINNIISELNSGIQAMRVDKIIDNVNYGGSLSGYVNPFKAEGSLTNGVNGINDPFVHMSTTLEKYKLPYSSPNEAILALEKYKKLTPNQINNLPAQERKNYEDLKKWRASSEVLNSKQYNDNLEKLSTISKDFEKKHGFKPQDVVKSVLPNPSGNAPIEIYRFKNNKDLTPSQIQEYNKYLRDNREINKQITEARNHAFNNYLQPKDNYGYVLSSETSVNNMINAHKSGIFAGVIGPGSDISNYNITNVKFPDSKTGGIQPDAKMKDQLAEILKTLDTSDLKGNPSIGIHGNKTSVTVTVKPEVVKNFPKLHKWYQFNKTGSADPQEGFTFTYERSGISDNKGVRTGLGYSTDIARQIGPNSANFANAQTFSSLKSQFQNLTGDLPTYQNINAALSSDPTTMSKLLGTMNGDDYVVAVRALKENINQQVGEYLKNENPSAYSRFLQIGTKDGMSSEELKTHTIKYFERMNNQEIK